MGKQVKFYMTPVDEVAFVTRLKSKASVSLVLNYFAGANPIEIETNALLESSNLDGFRSLSLVNKDINPKLIITPAGLGRNSLDCSQSEVIELTRWVMIRNDNQKEAGRLWYDHENMNCKPKRKVFVAWAESVFRQLKTSFHRSEAHSGRYFGPDAWEKYQAGEIELAPY